MKKVLKRPVFFFSFLLFITGSPVWALNVEVAQSAPVETTLQVPGIALTQKVWLDMISSAKKSIDLEQFYIHNKNGESLEPILQALMMAASRGVQVRFLVDIVFFKNYPEVPIQFSKIKNIQVKTIDFGGYGGIQHAKFFIVDQASTFIGSANFDWLALSHIHEVGLKIDDPQVAAGLGAVFAKDWAAGKPIVKALHPAKKDKLTNQLFSGSKKTTGVQVLASPTKNIPAGVSESLPAILNAFTNAKSEIKIQVYQYSTKGIKGRWLSLDQAIRAAAARGVQVKLLVDAVALKASKAELVALAGVKNVLVKAVSIPQWSGGQIDYARLVHSKYFTVDKTISWVGTENWSESYFSGCRNVGLILPIPSITAQLNQIFDRVWSSSYSAAL